MTPWNHSWKLSPRKGGGGVASLGQRNRRVESDVKEREISERTSRTRSSFVDSSNVRRREGKQTDRSFFKVRIEIVSFRQFTRSFARWKLTLNGRKFPGRRRKQTSPRKEKIADGKQAMASHSSGKGRREEASRRYYRLPRGVLAKRHYRSFPREHEIRRDGRFSETADAVGADSRLRRESTALSATSARRAYLSHFCLLGESMQKSRSEECRSRNGRAAAIFECAFRAFRGGQYYGKRAEMKSASNVARPKIIYYGF